MAFPTPLLYDAGTLSVTAPSMQDAGAPVAHAAPSLFSNPLLDRLEQQRRQAGSRHRRSPRSATSRRADLPSQNAALEQAVAAERAMYEQSTSFMIQDNEFRTTGVETNTLSEPINAS
eukprot:1653271-Pyramimonas_sp.AAC.1